MDSFHGHETYPHCFQNFGNAVKPALRPFLRFIATFLLRDLAFFIATPQGVVAGRGRSSASRGRSAGAVRREPSVASCPVATPPTTRPPPVAVAAGRGRREREGSTRPLPCSASTPCSASRR